MLTLSKSLWIEEDDIRTTAEDNFWRVAPGNWVRLKNAYNVFIKEVSVDENGKVVKVLAELDPDSHNVKTAKLKPKAAIHWLALEDSVDGTLAEYLPMVDTDGNEAEHFVANSVIKIEAHLVEAEGHFEFERVGYFYKAGNLIHKLAGLKGS